MHSRLAPGPRRLRSIFQHQHRFRRPSTRPRSATIGPASTSGEISASAGTVAAFLNSIGNTLSLNPQTLFLGGAQVGFNYEFGSGILVGAEADFDWLSNTTSSSNAIVLQNPTGTPTASTASLSANNRWLTTVVGRLGYAWDRILFYGKGGGAWVRSNTPSLTMDGAPVAISTSNGNWGFTGGVGIEWAFSGNWSARFEYDFVGLNQTFTLPTSAGGLPAGDQFTGNTRNIQLVNAGINYKFGGW